MKNKIKYLIISVLVPCFILSSQSSVLGAKNDGSSLIENYLEALEKQPGITNIDEDITAYNIIKLMVYYDCDKSQYSYLLDEYNGAYVGDLKGLYESKNKYNVHYKNEKIRVNIDHNSQFDPHDKHFLMWSAKDSEGIGEILSSNTEYKSISPGNSWLGILYAFLNLKNAGYHDFVNMLEKNDIYKDLSERLENGEVSDAENKFKSLAYEYAAAIRMQAIIGNNTFKNGGKTAGLYDTILSQCTNGFNADSNNGVAMFNLTLPAGPNDNSSANNYVSCSDSKDAALSNLAEMSKVVAGMKDKIKKEMEKLLSEGEIGDDLADAVVDLKDTEESATSNAANEAWEKYNQFIFSYLGYNNNGVPSMDLDTLTNRLQGLKDSGTLSQFDEFNDIIENDILGMVLQIGRYIIYAALLFFGVRCIWEGASGKAQFKAMLPYLLVALVFFYSGRGLVNVVQSVFDTYDYENYGMDVFASIVYIVRILAFAGILFTGVKLMFASAEAKADIKAHLIPIIIGCVFVFSSSLIVNIIVTTFDDAGFARSDDRSSIVIERNIDIM